jgi:hypothetical protein
MATVNRQVVCLITSAIAIVFIIFIITIIAGKSEEEEVGRKSRYSASPKSKVIEQRLELSKYHDNNDFYVYPSGDKYFFKRFQASEAMQRFMFGKFKLIFHHKSNLSLEIYIPTRLQ